MKLNGGIMESLVWHVYEHSFWKWQRNVPKFVARMLSPVGIFIKRLNKNPYYVPLSSFDGSQQLTHPDAVYWRGEFWLAVTPYPYSKECYEEPCVYRSKDGLKWRPCASAYPAAKIGRSEIRINHHSAPALLPTKDNLMLFYRRRERFSDHITEILLMRETRDGKCWNPPIKVSESSIEYYISPAVLTSGDGYVMFHIDLYEHMQTGALMLRRSTNAIHWGESFECAVNGLAPGHGIWHIAVCASDGGREMRGGKLAGLFVIKHTDGDYIGVSRAFSSDFGQSWRMGKMLSLPESLKWDMNKPYKASFMPGSGDILISIEDKQGRWYIYRVPPVFGV